MLPLGTQLGGTFKLERLIGHGGQACVFEVSHARLPRRFAAKIVSLDADAEASGFTTRFRREAEILASLASPHCVAVTDWNVQEEFAYLIMEMLDGETLAARLQREGPMEPPLVSELMRQIGEAVHAAHQRGVLHCDLKPSNLFLVRNNRPFIKVLDFGIAKLLHGAGGPQTDRSGIIGTPGYMSPEQVRGEALDELSDQFALGAVAYEMLAGRPAFYCRGEPPLAALQRVTDEDPPPLRPELGALDRVLRVALQKTKALRYRSVPEFVEALMQATRDCGALPAAAPEAQSTGTNPAASASDSQPSAVVIKARNPPARMGALWGGLVILGVLLGLTVSQRLRSPPSRNLATPPPAAVRPAAAIAAGPSAVVWSEASAAALPEPAPAAPVRAMGARPIPAAPAPAAAAQPSQRKVRISAHISGVTPAQRDELLPCLHDLQELNPQRRLAGVCLTLSGHSRLRLIPSGPLPFPPEHLRVLDECLATVAQATKLPTEVTACFRKDQVQ